MATRDQDRDAMTRWSSRGIILKMNDGWTIFIEDPNFIGFPTADGSRRIATNNQDGMYYSEQKILGALYNGEP
jgi:hypothetical protein